MKGTVPIMIATSLPKRNDEIDADDILDDPDLIDPDDSTKTKPLDLGEELQRQIVAHIIEDAKLMEFAALNLDPNIFCHKAHVHALQIVFGYFEKYQELIPKALLKTLFAEAVKARKDRIFMIAELNTCLDCCLFVSPAYFHDKVIELAQRYLIGNAAKKLIEDGNLKNYYAAVSKAQAIGAAQIAEDDLVCLDAIEFFDLAEAEERSWLLEDWLAAGSLHLFAGSKKIGKSTLVHSMIPALITGKPWFGKFETEPCRVLYLDFENPVDYVRANLLNNMPRTEWEAVRKSLFIPKKLPAALTGDILTQMMEKNDLGGQKGVIFIDSGMAAFNALFAGVKRVWDNTGSDVRLAMSPLLDVCRKTGWAVVVIHHDNKDGDTGGSVHWEAVCDYVLHYTVKGSGRTLSAKWGRWVAAKPESLSFEKPSDRLLLAGSAADLKAKDAAKDEDAKFAELLPFIPDLAFDVVATEENTVTMKDLIGKTGLCNSELDRRVKLMAQRGLIMREQLAKTKAFYHWRKSSIAP